MGRWGGGGDGGGRLGVQPWHLMSAKSMQDLNESKHACREKESRSHRGQQALQPLLPALLNVFLCGAVYTQREAAYAFANLLVGKGKVMYHIERDLACHKPANHICQSIAC